MCLGRPESNASYLTIMCKAPLNCRDVRSA